MTTLVKTLFATMIITLVSLQGVSAQEKGPCTDPDLPGETESTEEDSDDKKEEEDVQRDDSGNYWWNDNGEIKRVWPKDDPNAPWNRPSKSTSSRDDIDQANPNDSPGPYTDSDILIEMMLLMMDCGVNEKEALAILLSDQIGGFDGDNILDSPGHGDNVLGAPGASSIHMTMPD